MLRRLIVAVLLVGTAAQLAYTPDVDARRRRRRWRRRARHGFLQLNSTTTGADVLIDGKKVGSVPLSGPIKLKVGKHTLKMEKRGFTQFLDVFKIRRRKTTTLDVDLLPVASIFIVRANEKDARVYIDGKFVGTTPLEHEANIGKRTVRVRKAGFYDYIITRKAKAGETVTVEANLKPLPVGTTPYRPAPPPPRKWYEKWYVWTGIAAGVAAVAAGIGITVALATADKVADFNAQYQWKAAALTGIPFR